MYYKHRQYMGMTQNELLTHLTRQKKPPLVIETIMKTVAEQQRKLRTERITRIQHDLLWAPIIDPAKHELRIVERMRCTNTEDIPRQEALDRYAEVLRELLGVLTLARRKHGIVPSKLREKLERKGIPIPNKGHHWVDWVSESDKAEVRALFDAIPYKQYAKRKTPFERTIPKGEGWRDKRNKLQKRTELELAKAEHDLLAIRMMKMEDKSAAIRKRIAKHEDSSAKMKQVLLWVRDAEEGEALPPTWSGHYLTREEFAQTPIILVRL